MKKLKKKFISGEFGTGKKTFGVVKKPKKNQKRLMIQDKRFGFSVSLKKLVAVAKRAGYTDLSKVIVGIDRDYDPHMAEYDDFSIRLDEKY